MTAMGHAAPIQKNLSAKTGPSQHKHGYVPQPSSGNSSHIHKQKKADASGKDASRRKP